MSPLLSGLICLWTGVVVGIITAGVLHSSADADRDCYWQQVATTLANWAWCAGNSLGVSKTRHDAKPSEALHRAMQHVNTAVMRDEL